MLMMKVVCTFAAIGWLLIEWLETVPIDDWFPRTYSVRTPPPRRPPKPVGSRERQARRRVTEIIRIFEKYAAEHPQTIERLRPLAAAAVRSSEISAERFELEVLRDLRFESRESGLIDPA